MKKVVLHIENHNESKTASVDGELTIGRTDAAGLVVDDSGLSRVNTTVFRDGDMLYIVDDNSTNGTFVNGEKISGPPQRLNNRDEITIGTHTTIRVEIADEAATSATASTSGVTAPYKTENVPIPSGVQPPKKPFPMLLVAAGGMFFLIIFGVIGALLIASRYDNKKPSGGDNTPSRPQVNSDVLVPRLVIDPLGGQDPDDLDDLISSWEGVEEETLDTNNVDEVKASSNSKDADLNVPIDFWNKQKNLAMSGGGGGNDPAGTQIPRELYGDGVIKQTRKLGELVSLGYQKPLDFSDLAAKRLKGELIELPMATDWYFLDVGGSASENPFTAFSFEMGNTPISPGTAKYTPLEQLANNFSGQKYDLNDGRARRQMRIRLLRMFHPRAKPILERLAKAYQAQFKKPLRVTSLTRSMDYQIGLNASNPNSFKVRGASSLPPHTSGCAFDLARKHMSAAEQNFVMAELAKMEQEGILDALREGGVNACFHIFIFPDGRPPKM